jgi:hypothetical protein
MKRVVLFSTLCMLSGIAFAQSATEFTHTIDYKATTGTIPAKDFWIAIPQIYNTGDSGKYAEIYIASASATTVHIRGSRFAPVDKKLKPMEQFIFKVETQDIAKSMEMTTSGVKENKGIHIWSDGADLSVNLYIRNAVAGGGTMILPTSSWGKEYTVAAFEWNENEGGKPGEFTIVASEDSTEVTIVSPVPLLTSTAQAYPMNTPFSVLLKHGETIQFVVVPNTDYTDISGAVITSSKPIGVISAVQCAYIYYGTSRCDFMCEMMPPVCSWGKKYLAADHDGSGEGTWYSVVASQDHQEIYGYVDLMLDKYQPYFIRRYGSMVFQSEAPFLVTMYPASDPFSSLSSGHPSMVCLSPIESYAREVLFQAPADTTRNSLDIVYPTNARTKIDGISIDSLSKFKFGQVPGYDMFTVRSISKGVHRITSDSAISFSVNGWTLNNSFAWGGPLSPLCVDREDTLPPVASIIGDCNKSTITFTDTQQYATKIISYIIDSLENIRLELDPSFISGDLHNTFYYTLGLNDLSKPGKARISVIDRTGNMTTITSRIDARPNPKVTPTAIQIPYSGAVSNYRAFEFTNTTILPMTLTGPNGLRLSNGNTGFAFVAPDFSVLPVGAKRSFLVSYSSPNDGVHRDTVLFGDECTFVHLPLESINIGEVVSTTGVDLGCLAIGTSREDVVLVDNFGLYELTVLSVTFDDAGHFTAVAPTLPYIIPPEKRVGITVRYTPDAADTNCTTARIITKEVDELTATVCGCGLASEGVRTDASDNRSELLKALNAGKAFAWLAPVPNPADRDANVRFTFGLTKSVNVTLEFFDLEGKRIALAANAMYTSGVHELSVDLPQLSSGNYLYRYEVNGEVYSGKLTIR